MSDLGAINASNVSFQGSKEADKTKLEVAKKAPRVKSADFGEDKPKLMDKLTQPIKDEFQKAYGKDAEATPSLVADFVSDNIVKLGVLVAGGALLLAKSRKATNGLTEALKENIGKMKAAATEGEKTSIFKKTVDLVKNTYGKVKTNNLEAAKAAAEDAAKTGSKTLRQTVEEAILRPTKFEEGTKFAGFIDKHFGKHAPKIKETLGKIGISNGSDLADTAMAGAATVALGSGVNDIAGDVTEKDNKTLAREAKVKKFEDILTTASKIADTASMLAG